MSAAGLQQAAKRLTSDAKGFAPVKPLPGKGARPGEKSTGRPSAGGAASANTLQELDFAAREYWPAVQLTSSDGIFTFSVQPIKSIGLVGGGVFLFKQPV